MIGAEMVKYAVAAALLAALALVLPPATVLTLGVILVGARLVLRGAAKRYIGLFRYSYDGWLLAAGLVAIILDVPDVAVILMLLSAGIGAPFLFAATAFAYGVCARPAVIAWINGGPALGYAISGAAVAALAVLPGLVGGWQARRDGQELRSGDREPARPAAVRSLEIVRPSDTRDFPFDAAVPCDAECRAFVAAGRARWVRIVVLEGSGDTAKSRSTFHTLKADGDCKDAIAHAIAAIDCVTLADDPGSAADIVVTFEKGGLIEPGRFDLAMLRAQKSVVARRLEGGIATEVLRQTEVTFDVPVMPAALVPSIRGMRSSGVGLLRRPVTSNAISLRRTLLTLGLLSEPDLSALPAAPKPRHWTQGVDAPMTRDATAVLDLAQTAPFNEEQAAVLSAWIEYARAIVEWTPGQIALLRRIVNDRRMRSPTYFDQIFTRDPAMTRAFLPDVVALLEERGVSRDYTPERQAAYRFSNLDPALLAPFSARLLALMDKNTGARGILLGAVGRLGVDPSPYLTPFADDLDDAKRLGLFTTAGLRVQGACFAEAKWAPSLVPALRSALADTERLAKRRMEFEEDVLKALANLGDGDFVFAALARRGDESSKRTAERIRGALADPRRRLGLCSG